jgi:hypothetical protein
MAHSDAVAVIYIQKRFVDGLRVRDLPALLLAMDLAELSALT